MANDDEADALRPIQEVLPETLECISSANTKLEHITGIPTGFDGYDQLSGGLHDGELTVFAGRPGVGTTSFVLSVALNVASSDIPQGKTRKGPRSNRGHGVLIFSLGTPRRAIVTRMLCSEVRVDMARVRTGLLTKAHLENLAFAAERLAGMNIWVVDEPRPSIADIRAKVGYLQACFDRFDSETGARTRRLGLLVIDGWRRVRGGRKALRRLRAIGRELMLPIIVTGEYNPASNERDEGKRPQLSGFPFSDDEADNVCFIHRDSYYRREADPSLAELIVAWNRNGPFGMAPLHWEPEFGRFENRPAGEQEARSA
jgi:replicative DNA helicase